MTLLIFNDATQPYPDAQQTAWGTALVLLALVSYPERDRQDSRVDTQQEDTMKQNDAATDTGANHETDQQTLFGDRSGQLAKESRVPAGKPDAGAHGTAVTLDDVSISFGITSPSAMSPPAARSRGDCARRSVRMWQDECVARINRLHDHTGGVVRGTIRLGSLDVYGTDVQPEVLRSRIGMVFQKPNPFPTMSIFDNVISGCVSTVCATSASSAKWA